MTVMIMNATSAMVTPEEEFEMICDRPFAYRIGYRFGGQDVTLFYGAYYGD